ncbi:MAG: T9SS type A sorting domain-containing protein [Lewinellaceae bacterium]|nr:T9SS type A sorting domain-containing protein [Saprospiraceae bacterium]MCB9340349.1 T9SS type A sorting domain-containing protein [Lewinellaceae bacterium]
MNATALRLIWLIAFFPACLFAQLEFKVQLMDDDTWGVYVRSTSTDALSNAAYTASGQVTVVMPAGFVWTGPFQANAGMWSHNSAVVSPAENPSKQYVSFGLANNNPPIHYPFGGETLLFSFDRVGSCPDSIYLIDCNSVSGVTDPFCPDFPDGNFGTNSLGTNPGNSLSVVDIKPGVGTFFYDYSDNYAHAAWSCHDCDGDGILNALEDTNGNGSFDPGIDSSALCDPCDPFHPEAAEMELIFGAGAVCAGEAGDTAYFKINISGGWWPYDVYFTSDETDTLVIFDYVSGDSIAFLPSITDSLHLLYIIDSFGCLLDTALTGGINFSVHGPIKFIDQPDNMTQCSSLGTYFKAKVQNIGEGIVQYNWQISDDWGNSYTDLNNTFPFARVFTDSMNIYSEAGLDGKMFRLKAWTSVCDSIYSEGATLHVPDQINFNINPGDAAACAGDGAKFIACVENPTDSNYFYWQYSIDFGITWDSLEMTGVFSHSSNGELMPTSCDTLFISDVSGLYGYKFRAATHSACMITYTNPAMLTVEGPIVVAIQPAPNNICTGGVATFKASAATASGSGIISNQWQVSSDNGTTWTDIDATTDGGVYSGFQAEELNISDVTGLYGRQYRAKFSTAFCTPVYSNYASLYVDGPIDISQHPSDVIQCENENALFAVGVTNISPDGGIISYQWQRSDNGGATWSNISNDTLFNGAKTDSLSLSLALPFLTNNLFRCRVNTGTCSFIYSHPALLTSVTPDKVSQEPQDLSLCLPYGNTYAVIEENGIYPTYYQWEMSCNNGITWLEVEDGQTYSFSGANTTSLEIGDLAGLEGCRFRLRYWNDYCAAERTQFATVTQPSSISFSQQPEDALVCPADGHVFSSAALDLQAPGSILQYQWQMRQNSGSPWGDVAEGDTTQFGGKLTGTNSPLLSISNTKGLNGRQFRLKVVSGNCKAFSAPALLSLDPTPGCNGTACLNAKLVWIKSENAWGVFVKPSGAPAPVAGSTLMPGRLTIVSREGFNINSLSSQHGDWSLTASLANPASNPGAVYYTFENMQLDTGLLFNPSLGIPLFSFKKLGDCPDSLYIMEGNSPQGIEGNYLSITDPANTFYHSYLLCGVSDQLAWMCSPNTPNWPNEEELEVFSRPGKQKNLIDSLLARDGLGENMPGSSFFNSTVRFTIAPNPAKDKARVILFDTKPGEKGIIQVWDATGKKLLAHNFESTDEVEINLQGIAPGLYFFGLQMEGSKWQWEKVMVI